MTVYNLAAAANSFETTVYDFESGLEGWTVDPDGFWRTNSKGTGSGSTGPSAAYSGTQYLYCETSNPFSNGQSADVRSPEFDATNGSVVFNVSAYGDSNHTFSIFWDDGAVEASLFSTAFSSSPEWQQVNVDFSALGVSGLGSLIVRVETGAVGTSFQADGAIDAVRVTLPSSVAGFVSGVPGLGRPSIAQAHDLSASSIAVGAPELGNPAGPFNPDELGAQGQAAFTTVGTFQWEVPAGVTEIHPLAVGGGGGGAASTLSQNGYSGGGGGGGGLHWRNGIPVTPGEILTIVVGSSGLGGSAAAQDDATGGGDSAILRAGVDLLRAHGGSSGVYGNSPAVTPGGGNGVSTLGGGGGIGGDGGAGSNGNTSGGGGGAAGYTGYGGNGSSGTAYGFATAGSAGGGGGATGANNLTSAVDFGGGGVGIFGQGASGGVPDQAFNQAGSPGSGGSGQVYGGGGSGAEDDSSAPGGDGGQGAVRIIWGTQRAWPATLTSDQPVIEPPSGDGLAAANIESGAPTVGVSIIRQIHLIAAVGVAAVAPVLAAAAFSQAHILIPAGLDVARPSIGGPGVAEAQSLTGVGVTAGRPVLGLSAIRQRHELRSVDLASGAPDPGSSLLAAVPAVFDLIARGLASGSPSIAAPDLRQDHGLTAEAVAALAPASSYPALAQRHGLTAFPVSGGVPAVGFVGVFQVHRFAAEELTIGRPEASIGGLTQAHGFVAEAFSIGLPALGSPALVQLVAVDGLFAIGVTTARPVLYVAGFAQAHAIGVENVTAGAPFVGFGAVTQGHSLTADGLGAGRPTSAFPGLGQSHNLAAVDVSVKFPAVGLGGVTQSHVLFASFVSADLPAIGSPVLTPLLATASARVVVLHGAPSSVPVIKSSAVSVPAIRGGFDMTSEVFTQPLTDFTFGETIEFTISCRSRDGSVIDNPSSQVVRLYVSVTPGAPAVLEKAGELLDPVHGVWRFLVVAGDYVGVLSEGAAFSYQVASQLPAADPILQAHGQLRLKSSNFAQPA